MFLSFNNSPKSHGAKSGPNNTETAKTETAKTEIAKRVIHNVMINVML